MRPLTQLQLTEIKLEPGEEWLTVPGVWRFLRLHQGAAYWLGVGVIRSLAEGEMLVVAPRLAGSIRASQLTPVVVHGFSFSAELLGFFTLGERQVLEKQAHTEDKVNFLPSTHPVAHKFSAHVATASPQSHLTGRVAGLDLVAAYFNDALGRQPLPATRQSSTPERFTRLIVQMPETELINHTPEELARLCGCSARHFNRLFQQRFGTSARARQTELRLQKARQLLAASDEKIVHLALECGYHNLSLFNYLFKKRFGMTPSQSRKNDVKIPDKPRRRVATTLLSTCFLAMTLSAAETNSPALAAVVSKTNAPLTFRVDRYDLQGASVLPPEVLTPIFEKYTGEAVTFETIRKARTELLMAYRVRGFVTVAVEVPPQKLTNGVVQLKVTEGVLADVVVKNNKHYSVENILRALPAARTNTLLNGLVFQQQLDRANANSDRQIYPVIAPGPEPGTTTLELRVKDRLPFHLHMELNNHSTPKSPDMRMNLSGTYNNLWQRDHQVGVQYSLTPEALKDDTDGSPRVQPWDRPLIASYSAYYRLPLAPINGYPQGYDLREFGYDEVTHRFRPPPINGAAELLFYGSRSYADTSAQLTSQTTDPAVIPPSGAFPQIVDTLFTRSLSINENLGVRFSKPLPALGRLNSTLSLGLDVKNFRSLALQHRRFQAILIIPSSGSVGPPFTVIPSPPIDSTNRIVQTVAYLPLTLDWGGSVADKFGTTFFDLNQSYNLIGNKNDFQAVAGATGADGNYYIASASLTRDQKIWSDWGVRLHADGQWASQPLISNEQFGVGGQAGVRGFREGRQYGDCGWRVQFEPHTPYLNCGAFDGDVPMLVRGYGFLDYGQTFSLNSTATPGIVSLMGAGCGLDASVGEHFDFRLMLGVPLISPPDNGEANPVRVAFSIGMQL